ncbi:MAG: UDP-N-acetylmuramoyl-L-alanine--D-glutamate ligase [Fibrobacterales bacterium]
MYKERIREICTGRVGILGFGVEGKSTLSFLTENGIDDCIIFDKNPVDLVNFQVTCVTGEGYLEQLSQCDVLFRSAGISPTQPELITYVQTGGELTSQVELFFELWGRNIIGVTGTLGKGTCVSMIDAICKEARLQVLLGGNIGIPVLDLLKKFTSDTIALLELSSFQLMTLRRSPRIAVVLKTTSEHLDWHSDQQEYIDAKTHLVSYQDKDDLCIFYGESECSIAIAGHSIAQKKSFGSGGNAQINGRSVTLNNGTISIDDCALSGIHNLQNMAAALIATEALGVSFEVASQALVKFQGLKYRLQKVLTIEGDISFYNDSYATRPDATIGALSNFKQPVALILGGSEKNADFSELFKVVRESKSVFAIALIGQAADRIESGFLDYNIDKKISKLESLEQAVEYCIENCNIYKQRNIEGERGAPVVLLSPACASFGMFKNYVQRGDTFNEIVNTYARSRV